MSRRKKIRVPATTVALVEMLGHILRNEIKFRLRESACWTFEFVTEWQISTEPEPEEDDVTQDKWFQWDYYHNPDHQMSTYIGSGYCHPLIAGRGKKLDLRVRCEHVQSLYFSYWEFYIWTRDPDGEVTKYHYRCHLGYGYDRDYYLIEGKESNMPDNPPRKIAFWREGAAT